MPIFNLTLHSTYYNQGFFNVSVDFDRFVAPDGPVILRLGVNGPAIQARIDRRANTNGTARILGRTRLRDWFQKNFEPKDIIAVDLSSREIIVLDRRFDGDSRTISPRNPTQRQFTLKNAQQERLKIYFAGPLFSEADRDWIRSTIQQIESFSFRHGAQIEIIFPYDLITQSEIESLGNNAKHEIFSRCKSHLDDADMVIALLDGPQVDDGTAWEIGYFYARKKPGQKIIGIRTDFRRAGECEGAHVNSMIAGACEKIVRTKEELLEVVFQDSTVTS